MQKKTVTFSKDSTPKSRSRTIQNLPNRLSHPKTHKIDSNIDLKAFSVKPDEHISQYRTSAAAQFD